MAYNSNFINHKDPTAPLNLDIDPTSIEYQYSMLTEDEKIAVGAKLLGMNHIPVTFDQFICDPYFLGSPNITNSGRSIFDIWKKVGEDIYPTPISTKTPYVSFGG